MPRDIADGHPLTAHLDALPVRLGHMVCGIRLMAAFPHVLHVPLFRGKKQFLPKQKRVQHPLVNAIWIQKPGFKMPAGHTGAVPRMANVIIMGIKKSGDSAGFSLIGPLAILMLLHHHLLLLLHLQQLNLFDGVGIRIFGHR